MNIQSTSINPAITTGTATTNSDTAVTPISAGAVAGKLYGGGIIFNPSGSAAGQVSFDRFVNDIRSLPAGPGALLIESGGVGTNGVQVRRIPGQSDVSGATVILW